jgi:hypothetical protein
MNWETEKMSYDEDESDAAYNARNFSDEAIDARRAYCYEQAANEANMFAQQSANEAAALKSNPWPTDPTALRGNRMGLQEWIRERGD